MTFLIKIPQAIQNAGLAASPAASKQLAQVITAARLNAGFDFPTLRATFRAAFPADFLPSVPRTSYAAWKESIALATSTSNKVESKVKLPLRVLEPIFFCFCFVISVYDFKF
jgi:hypothetical protein